MGGDDAPSSALAELSEHGFGYCAAYLGLGACAKLVDEQEGAPVGIAYHRLHVEKVRRVGGEVVLYALLVAYVNHDVPERAAGTAVANGNRESALQHVLQQSHSLEADGLTASIGTRDDKDYSPGLTHSLYL